MSQIPRQLQERIERNKEILGQKTAEMKQRLSENMKSNSSLQQRERLGSDGRMREAIEIQTQHIYERAQYAEAIPSYDECRRRSQELAEKIVRKRGGE